MSFPPTTPWGPPTDPGPLESSSVRQMPPEASLVWEQAGMSKGHISTLSHSYIPQASAMNPTFLLILALLLALSMTTLR